MVKAMNGWKKLLCLGILGLAIVSGPAAAQLALTPAETAVLKRDLQKAEDQYVRKIATITGVRESAARRALPDRARITDPVNRVISALERDLGKPLSDEQKAALRNAEIEYSTARKDAEKQAYKK